MKYKFLLIILFSLLLTACQSEVDKRLAYAFDLAGDNHIELEKVLEHYKNDSLKQKAARYLIYNMPFHFSRMEYFMSPDGEQYIPDVAAFPDDKVMKRYCDSLQSSGYRIQKEIIYDVKTLSSDYLIRNIDLAFKVWQKPWAQALAFDDFCRHLLPYRAQTEPASDMRRELMEHYLPLLDSAHVNNAFDACMIINAQLMKDLKYKETGSPLYPTITETYHAQKGNCEGLCNLGTMAMRAVGIPIAVQSTTWSKMDLGHNWCVVLSNDKFYDFNPADCQPDSFKLQLLTYFFLKPAKVYRFLFEPEFKKAEMEDDGYITHLKSPLLRDVTAEGGYEALNISIETDKNVSTAKRQIYLCAYNNDDWVPLAIGSRNGSKCEFKNVAGNNVFIVAEATDTHTLRYITTPFIFKKDGSIRKLMPDMNTKVNQSLYRTPGEKPQNLFYWEPQTDRFKRIECDGFNDSLQFYTQIPDNALLWYKPVQKVPHQRVSFIENDTLKRVCDF